MKLTGDLRLKKYLRHLLTVVLSVGLLTACSQDYGITTASLNQDLAKSSESVTQTSVPTRKVLLNETYIYDSYCKANVVHSCAVVTELDVGKSVEAKCVSKVNEVDASTCMPNEFKTRVRNGIANTFYVTRLEANKYRVIFTLSGGFHKTMEISSLENLKSSHSEGQIDSL